MTIRLLSAALVAGFLAACVTTLLQLTLTSPLIIAAEAYEKHAEALPAGLPIVLAHGGDAAAPAHDHGTDAKEWEPGPGLPRMAYTGLAILVTAVGYALLLGAVLLAAGRVPSPEEAFRFAVGGFLVTSLAPAAGLPPELPGMEAAPLAARQLWWIGTVIASGAGLYLLAIVRSRAAVIAGLALIAAPHLVGAPHRLEADSALPAGYAAEFAARSLAVSFAFWSVLGLAYGWAWERFGAPRGAAAPVRA